MNSIQMYKRSLVTKSNPVIIVDLDDTTMDTTPAWVKRMRERYDVIINPEDWKVWDLSQIYDKETTEKLYSILDERGFFRNLAPKEGAVENLTLLHDLGFDLLFLTMAEAHQMQEKSESVDEHFGHLERITLMTTSKNPRKDVVNGRFLVDDAPQFLLSSPAEHKIVMDRVVNRFITDLPRAYTWDDVLVEVLKTQFKDERSALGMEAADILGWIDLTEKELTTARERFKFHPRNLERAEKNLTHILRQHHNNFLQAVKRLNKGVAVS